MGGGSKYRVVTLNLTDNKPPLISNNKGVHMDIETITKLLDAGYTKADIDAMQGSETDESARKETETAGSETDESARKETETAGKDPGDAGAVDVSETIKALTDTVAGLTATVKAMQDANAKGAKTKSASAGDAIGDAMKSFIDKL